MKDIIWLSNGIKRIEARGGERRELAVRLLSLIHRVQVGQVVESLGVFRVSVGVSPRRKTQARLLPLPCL